MACGLGAVALMLIFIKTNSDPANDSIKEISLELEAKLQILDVNNLDSELIISDYQIKIDNILDEIVSLNKQIQSASNLSSLSDKTAKKLNDEINLKPKKIIKNVSKVKGYLSGCNIEGKDIGFFIDSSASMYDKNIIDIIRYKASNKVIKENAPKWVQAKKIFKWLFDKTNKDTNVIALSFSDTINFVSEDLLNISELKKSSEYNNFFNDLVPKNGTNLKQLVSVIKKKKLDSVYIITDSFPTLPISENKKCSNENVISPYCRKELFYDFSNSIRSLPNKPKVNFIMMPIEGDYSSDYWFSRLAMDTGGCFITASKDWLVK